MSEEKKINYFDLLVQKLRKLENINVYRIDIHYHEIFLIFQDEEVKIKVDNDNHEYNYDSKNSPDIQSAISEALRNS